MSDTAKTLLMILVILYVVSPLDLVPGPIDDAILLLMTLASRRGKSRIEAT